MNHLPGCMIAFFSFSGRVKRVYLNFANQKNSKIVESEERQGGLLKFPISQHFIFQWTISSINLHPTTSERVL
jgi:hypothetical protein